MDKKELPGLVWAAPLRGEGDRDDLVAITERRGDDQLVLTLHVFRFEGGKLVRLVEQAAYTLTGSNARWIGARLEELRLLATVEARPDGYEVGGALVHLNGDDRARDVAPLLPVRVERRRRAAAEPAAVPSDARSSGAAPRDAGVPRDAEPAPPDR